MNKNRRAAIAAACAKIEEAKGELETARDEEQDYFDNMPESFQQGEKGSDAETAVQALEDAIEGCDNATGALGDYQ